ncbi:MAG: pilus assembly protein PilB [Phycisphaeraceae bacterium]|nr:pilus assembly protein PilB [Phycisphaeraceae bacterium]
MARKRRKIGEQLKRWGLINDAQLEHALKLGKAQGMRVGEALIELGHVTDGDVAKALAAQFEMDYIDLDQPDAVNSDNMTLLPSDLIKKYLVLPLEQSNGRLRVLIHDPMDLELLDNLRFRMNCEIDAALGSRVKIKEYIDQMLSETQESIDKEIRELSLDASIDRGQSMDIQGLTIDQEAETDEEAEADQAPIVRLVHQIIVEAVQGRASDIHIEPFTDRVRLRYRIDGVCHERNVIPKRTQSALTARIKILSGMRVEEKRNTQDGRIKLKVDGEVIDFRVSACPAYHGESVVLRILRPESARIGLANLGMRHDTQSEFERIIRRPNGIFLVTGPTGSGKTTTLYTALDVLNRPDRKIITAEDPVEYNFNGINQCQVNEAIELTFAKVLRAMLRQAPNVILVGEIRDVEVATVAIQAALTGHLVFSTLHTNDAPSAITRLIDIGVKPFLVASSIQAVLAQRLVRILCDDCKKEVTDPNPRLMQLCNLKPEELEGQKIYEAVGCPICSNTGFHGRRGIYELMLMNSEIRDLAFKRAPLNQVRDAAQASGMRNLLGDGKLKVLDGVTTLDEVSKIAQVEGLVDVDEVEDVA